MDDIDIMNSLPFSIMTEKMKMLYKDVIASLGQLPDEQRGYIFGFEGEEDIEWVVGVAEYIIFEYIKYSFDYDDPEYPLNHFVEQTNDSERMLQSRVMQYVLKYKKREIDSSNVKISPGHKFADTEMETIDKKLKGHRITEMNYFEHQNIHDLDLIKTIVERRIVSSKKISNDRFKEMFEQYDRFVEQLVERSKKSDEDMVFASIALFTLEWHYPIETLYYLSCIMEEEGIREIDRRALVLICGRVWVESKFLASVSTDSRMVKERQIVIPYLFGKDTDDFGRCTMQELIKEIIVLGVLYKEKVSTNDGELYRDWFRKESDMQDWASFLRYYDIFSIWEKKEWTRTRMQNMRYLFDLILSPKL